MKASTACLLAFLYASVATVVASYLLHVESGPVLIVSAICFIGHAICRAIEDKEP